MSVSRNIEHNLDREKEDFELSVSSPGLDQPFVVPQQYLKNIGRKISAITKEKYKNCWGVNKGRPRRDFNKRNLQGEKPNY